MINFDLHSHTTYSDGTLAPAELVARAARRGVTTLAVTDHDTVDGLNEARATAAEIGVRLIDGVEISVTWRSHTLHIVGLGIHSDDAELHSGLAATRSGRVARAHAIAAAFDAIGIHGTLEGALRLAAYPQAISRTHFARFLQQQGIVKDANAAFKRFLGDGQRCYVGLQWASLNDAVHWIVGSGGLAVIAHPGRYKLDAALMRELLAEFKELGGGGIEVITSGHKPHQRRTFGAHARYYGLAASAGSDFHSPEESYRDLGNLTATPEFCASILSRLQ